MKMNKIVASVSAAALAVSALATSAFAAGPYTVEVTSPKLDNAKITLEATLAAAGDVTHADLTDFQTGEIKAEITQTVTGTDGIYDLEFNGSVSFEESAKVNYQNAGGDDKSTTLTSSGSANIDKLAIGGGMKKEVKFTPTGINDLTLQAMASVTGIEKSNPKPTIKITLTTTVWDKDNLEAVFGSEYSKWFNDVGLPKDASRLKTAVSKDLVDCVGSLIKVTTSGAVDTALNATTDTWKVKGIECTEGKEPTYLKKNGTLQLPAQIPFKGNFNFDALKDMTNGGTVTLKFDKAVDAGKQYSVNVAFSNADLYLGSTNGYNVSGDTLTFEMPADFSGTLDGIYGLPLMQIWSSDWTMPDNCALVSVTLTPKSAADVAEATTTAPTANEGDEQTNKPANTDKPATPSADGDKNQPTGVAIAIVPAIVAAAGVIISKKRK